MTPNPHTTPTTDDLTQRILHGLRTAEPAPDFEARLLHTLATHQHQVVTRRTLTHPLRWLAATASLTAATLALVLALHPTHAPVHPTRTTAPTQNQADTPPKVATVQSHPALHLRPQRHKTALAQPEPAAPLTTLALAEATAPSQPPPPLPITTEERQIQRFTSRHTAFDLASLSPAAELAHEAADRQAFHDFFHPPPPALPPTQPSAPTP